jgi:hypothetical protein
MLGSQAECGPEIGAKSAWEVLFVKVNGPFACRFAPMTATAS